MSSEQIKDTEHNETISSDLTTNENTIELFINNDNDNNDNDNNDNDNNDNDNDNDNDNNNDKAIVDTEIISLIDLEKDELLIKIKHQIIEEIKEQCIDKPLVIKLITKTMEIVETTSFKGSDQKELVIDILVKILETDELNCPNRNDLIIFLKEYAGNIIDIIVDASRGKININKVESLFTIIINILFCCLKKKV